MHQIEIKNTVDSVKTPATYDENNVELTAEVLKTAQEISDEEDQLIADKTSEIQGKVDTYIAAQTNQIQNGGAGPVADFETMKIVNEHSGSFEVIFKI